MSVPQHAVGQAAQGGLAAAREKKTGGWMGGEGERGGRWVCVSEEVR